MVQIQHVSLIAITAIAITALDTASAQSVADEIPREHDTVSVGMAISAARQVLDAAFIPELSHGAANADVKQLQFAIEPETVILRLDTAVKTGIVTGVFLHYEGEAETETVKVQVYSVTFHRDGAYSVRVAVPRRNISRNAMAIRTYFPDSPIVVLQRRASPTDRTLSIHSYVADGKEFVPVFSSAETFKESTKVGGEIQLPKIAIKRELLLQVTSDDTLYRLDPHLKSELWVTGRQLKHVFANSAEPLAE